MQHNALFLTIFINIALTIATQFLDANSPPTSAPTSMVKVYSPGILSTEHAGTPMKRSYPMSIPLPLFRFSPVRKWKTMRQANGTMPTCSTSNGFICPHGKHCCASYDVCCEDGCCPSSFPRCGDPNRRLCLNGLNQTICALGGDVTDPFIGTLCTNGGCCGANKKFAFCPLTGPPLCVDRNGYFPCQFRRRVRPGILCRPAGADDQSLGKCCPYPMRCCDGNCCFQTSGDSSLYSGGPVPIETVVYSYEEGLPPVGITPSQSPKFVYTRPPRINSVPVLLPEVSSTSSPTATSSFTSSMSPPPPPNSMSSSASPSESMISVIVTEEPGGQTPGGVQENPDQSSSSSPTVTSTPSTSPRKSQSPTVSNSQSPTASKSVDPTPSSNPPVCSCTCPAFTPNAPYTALPTVAAVVPYSMVPSGWSNMATVSPTSPTSPVGTSNPNTPTTPPILECFPGSARVQVESQTATRLTTWQSTSMDLLQIGDRIRSGARAHDSNRVFLWTHRQTKCRTCLKLNLFMFIRLTVGTGQTLTASRGHLIYICEHNGSRQPIAMQNVIVGKHKLCKISENATEPIPLVVVKKQEVFDRGLYNPHTASGDIVVDGFLCSCYTTAIDDDGHVAHGLLTPIRALANSFFLLTERFEKSNRKISLQ